MTFIGSEAVRFLTVTLFALICIPSRAISQEDPKDIACVRELPRSAYHRVGVGLDAVAYDNRGKVMLPSADILAQTVAFRIRSMMGGSEERIPDADTLLVSPLGVYGAIRVTATPDGKFTWRGSTTAPSDLSRSAIRLVVRALEQLSTEGEMVMWPEGAGQDPVTFGLVVVRPKVNRDGVESAVKARQPVPIFMIEIPWEKPVELTKKPRIFYPNKSRANRMMGGVEIEYIVDQDGKVVPGSFTEVWPADRPKLSASDMEYYRAFLRAVERGFPTAEFSPAIIGGCPVKQKVKQIINFELGYR
jgi:hypothetical protein